MNISDNSLNILSCLTYKGIGKAWVVKQNVANHSEDGLVELLNKSNGALAVSLDDFRQRKNYLAERISQYQGLMDGVVGLGDEAFPAHRGKVTNAERPVALFYKGDLSLLSGQTQAIAVIGLLNPDPDTVVFEQKVVDALVSKGAIIVSGLAKGCDTVAHQQALASQGKTLAILPSPLHNILPTENRKLAADIVDKGGLLLTEYLTDAKSKFALSGRYQERDRLQALFSDGILLAASYAKNDLGNDSGSRLAMGYAEKYGITRAVTYNPESDELNPKYDLNRQIMQADPSVLVVSESFMSEVLDKLVKVQVSQTKPGAQTGLFLLES